MYNRYMRMKYDNMHLCTRRVYVFIRTTSMYVYQNRHMLDAYII